MTIADWILLGSIIITAGLLIYSYIKKVKLLQKISECLIIPLFAVLVILLLREYLPDSLHLIKVTTIALSLVTVSTIFISFESKKLLRVSGRILVLSSLLCWISLYKSIFYIHNVPAWLIILMSLIYIAALVTAIILSGKQPFLFYILFAIGFALSAYLHFCSLLFLCYERRASAIMLFAGASIFLILNAFHFINQAKLKFKHAGVIRYSLLIASQVLIACSNILMIS